MASPTNGAVRLRPMGLRDILDESLDLYRSNFGLYTGIAFAGLVPATAVMSIFMAPAITILNAAAGTDVSQLPPTSIAAISLLFMGAAWTYGLLLLPFITGAQALASSERYLGRASGVRAAYGPVLRRFFPFLATSILAALPSALSNVAGTVIAAILDRASSGLGPLFVVASFVAAAWFTVKLSLTPLAFVIEDARYVRCLRRSWELVTGHFWRTLAVLLAAGILIGIGVVACLVVAMVVAAVVAAITRNAGAATSIMFALAFAAYAVFQPIQMVAMTLLYYDLRIRKEGFDLQMLAAELGRKVESEPALPPMGGIDADVQSPGRWGEPPDT